MTTMLKDERSTCCESLGQLLLKYAPMVRSICTRRLGCRRCDDLQQEAFLRVLRTCHLVRDRQHLPAYLRAVTSNLCSDRIRSRMSRPRAEQLDEEHLQDPRDQATDHDQREELDLMRRHVRRLPTGLRQVLELFYFNRMNYAQIARHTGLTIGAVGQRLTRARHRLRQKLT